MSDRSTPRGLEYAHMSMSDDPEDTDAPALFNQLRASTENAMCALVAETPGVVIELKEARP